MSGPEYVLSETLQLFDEIRALKSYRSAIPASYVRTIRSRATRCIQLLLDHKMLNLQREWALARQQRLVSTSRSDVSKLALVRGGAIPRLRDLHTQLRPAGMPSSPFIGREHSVDLPLMTVLSSESDNSSTASQPELRFADDPFVRVSAIELLLNGSDSSQGDSVHESGDMSNVTPRSSFHAPGRQEDDDNLLDLSTFLQSTPDPYTRSPIRSDTLFLSSESSTSTSTSAPVLSYMRERSSSSETPYFSRSDSVADSVGSAGEHTDDIFKLLASPTAAYPNNKERVRQELLRPPTPDAFDQFSDGQIASRETQPFAVSVISSDAFSRQSFPNDPFAVPPASEDPFAKPRDRSIDLLTSDTWNAGALQRGDRLSQSVLSTGDLLDLMNPHQQQFSSVSSSDIFGSTQPLDSLLTSYQASSPTTQNQYHSNLPLTVHPSHIQSPPQTRPQWAMVPAAQMLPMASNQTASSSMQHKPQPVTPVRQRVDDPFADLALSSFKRT